MGAGLITCNLAHHEDPCVQRMSKATAVVFYTPFSPAQSQGFLLPPFVARSQPGLTLEGGSKGRTAAGSAGGGRQFLVTG